jgi:N-acetylmuramoyl-L-alanine amidase
MIRVDLLTPNPSSRPGLAIRRVDALVLHWVGNPGTSAEANRRYFESLKDGSARASAHYIIDAKEIVRCVPEAEVAYHCGQVGGQPYAPWAAARWGGEHPNLYTIGIEHAHPDWVGVWEPKTVAHSRWLCAGLCWQYGLDPLTDIVRHFDITGKPCPQWFVAVPTELDHFRRSVKSIMEVLGG